MKVLLSVDSALGFQGTLFSELCKQRNVSADDVTVILSQVRRALLREVRFLCKCGPFAVCQ